MIAPHSQDRMRDYHVTTFDSLRRPTTLEELKERGARFSSEESRKRGMAFQPRATDVIISPYPKCGTTWLQQIVHGLRTRGDMNFDEITAVVPWLEMAHILGLDLEAPQPFPRAYKSHLDWNDVPKGGRYLISIREPKDALTSSYRFLEGWWFEPGSISFEAFAQSQFIEDRSYWRHLASWLEHRTDPNILLLCYEEMKADLPQAVRTIADFIGIELDPELFEIVVRQSSLEFMLAHADRFDDHLVRNAIDPLCGLPLGGDSAKVTNAGLTPVRLEVPQAMRAELDAIWQEEITARFGFPSYPSLRAHLART
jgi:hypothetical protein